MTWTPRSLEAMRLWLIEESYELVRIWCEHGWSRERTRAAALYALELELRLDGERIEDYQEVVEEILDRELDEAYKGHVADE